MNTPQRRGMAGTARARRAAEAVSGLATRLSFLVVPWLVLATTGSVWWATLVVAAQVLAYVGGSALAARRAVPRLGLVAELAGTVALAGFAAVAAVHAPVLAVPGMVLTAALVGAARAVADRVRDAAAEPSIVERASAGPPPRAWLGTALAGAAGLALGVAAVLIGAAGGLWLTALCCAAAAALGLYADAPSPVPDAQSVPDAPVPVTGVPVPVTEAPVSVTYVPAGAEGAPAAMNEPTVEITPVVPRHALPGLRRDPLIRRLAGILLCGALLSQAAAVLLVAAWSRAPLPDAGIGLITGAFVLGAAGAAAALTAYTLAPGRAAALAVGFLAGGGALAVARGLDPVLLVPCAAAMVAGIALASVTPATAMVVGGRVPPAVRARTGGLVAAVAYAGVPVGTLLGAWVALAAPLAWACLVAALLYTGATLVPVAVHRSWREIAPPPSARSGSRLAGRVSVTLAYADGRWVVEVRRGRALLGRRYPVRSDEALRLVAALGITPVQRGVEQALAGDQDETSRRVRRTRAELADLEAKLSGLQEMVDLTERRDP